MESLYTEYFSFYLNFKSKFVGIGNYYWLTKIGLGEHIGVCVSYFSSAKHIRRCNSYQLFCIHSVVIAAKSHVIHNSCQNFNQLRKYLLHNKLQIKTLYPVSTKVKPINTKTYIGNKLTINNERSVFVEHIRLPVFLKRKFIYIAQQYN